MRLLVWGVVCAGIAWASPAIAQSAKPLQLGKCVWAQMPATTRDEFLAAHGKDTMDGMAVLKKNDAAIAQIITSCAGKVVIPPRWARGAVAAHAIQNGAAQQLSVRGITVEALDTTWRTGPAAALDCVAANAAKAFGIMDRVCPEQSAPLALLRALKISPQTDRAAAAQALTYFNAKAQEEWADMLIAKIPEKG